MRFLVDHVNVRNARNQAGVAVQIAAAGGPVGDDAGGSRQDEKGNVFGTGVSQCG